MIEKILELLYTDEYLAKSKYIDIAKGKYKIPLTQKKDLNKLKEIRHGSKKDN